jgi:1,4-dihydroxy-6-naphthoate synthase
VTAAPLTLGISPCPNDTFIFWGLVHGLVPGAPAVTVTYADIDECNTLAASKALDLVKVSYGALPWLVGDYRLLPCGGALGRGCGPLVLTTAPVPAAGLRGARVAVPGERTTAYLLLRLWAKACVPGGLGEIVVMPFDQIMPSVRAGTVDAGLVIHEARFTYPGYGLSAVADLGDWWKGETGLAIPLGAILARRDLDPAPLVDAIRRSVAAAWAQPAATRDYVLAHSQEMDPAVADAHIALYVNEFSAELGEAGYAAVHGLLDRAAAAGLVPSVAPAALR